MLELSWASGGQAWLEAVSGDLASLSSTVPAPPGARLTASCRLPATAGPAQIRLKVLRCTRSAEGRFEIAARLLSATRALRRELARALAPTEPVPSSSRRGG